MCLAVVNMIAFLALNQLPFRGDHDSVESMSESGSGLFLSFEYTLQKDAELAKIMETIIYTVQRPTSLMTYKME